MYDTAVILLMPSNLSLCESIFYNCDVTYDKTDK